MLAVAAGSARAAEYYVATTGSDSNAGTMDAPWATLQKAANTAAAGDTVWIRGGTYKITTPASSSAGVNFTKSGTSDTNRIKYWAYPGEVPVIDFSGMVISTTGYTIGFNVSGSYLHFKGLEIGNVPMNMSSNNGVSVGGSAATTSSSHSTCTTTPATGSSSATRAAAATWSSTATRTTTTIRIRTRAWDRTPTASAFTTRRRASRRSFAAAARGGTPTTATI